VVDALFDQMRASTPLSDHDPGERREAIHTERTVSGIPLDPPSGELLATAAEPGRRRAVAAVRLPVSGAGDDPHAYC
jgi:hypothetical protein